MKAALNTLSHPKTGEQLIIQTDSSMQGLAGFMFQRDDNGEPNIIAVASRSLKRPELNYSATEIEGLAVIKQGIKQVGTVPYWTGV